MREMYGNIIVGRQWNNIIIVIFISTISYLRGTVVVRGATGW